MRTIIFMTACMFFIASPALAKHDPHKHQAKVQEEKSATHHEGKEDKKATDDKKVSAQEISAREIKDMKKFLRSLQIHYQPNTSELKLLNKVDSLIKDNKLNDARFLFISTFEGSTRHSVDVGDGKRTIAFGFNMSTPFAKTAWKQVFANDPIADQFEDYYKGAKALTPDQERKLFDYVADQFSSDLDKMGLTSAVMTPHQRISLQSLFYNGGKGLIYPHLTNYILAGNHQSALTQILTKSNRLFTRGKPIPLAYGLSNRRLVEAALYAGPENFNQITIPKEHLGQIFQWLTACFSNNVNPEGDRSDKKDLFDIYITGREKEYKIDDLQPTVLQKNVVPLQNKLDDISKQIDAEEIPVPIDVEKL